MQTRPKKADFRPEILAPAGDRASFLAALAAGADAVYLGLKNFSARMEATNFSMRELYCLKTLAREKGMRVYVAMNVMVKPSDLAPAGRLVNKLVRYVSPDALIMADIGMAAVARQAGFEGEIHLSTLGCATHPAAVPQAVRMGFSRVILPRELSLEEIKACAAACPNGAGLEVFVHGALCFGVSGRCYWSSFLGGKSGLRGRCVQPCRRGYFAAAGKRGRMFSCRDLGLGQAVSGLLEIPQVKAWKIEGRKKGPHYVYHVTRAYRLLRDNPDAPDARDEAVGLLERSLGRPGTTYYFFSQDPREPASSGTDTGSGLLVGRVKDGPRGAFCLSPKVALHRGDLLRVGYEDAYGHQLSSVRENAAKDSVLTLRPREGEKAPPAGTPVFLIDRRDPGVMKQIRFLEESLEKIEVPDVERSEFSVKLPKAFRQPQSSWTMHVKRAVTGERTVGATGVWLTPDSAKKAGAGPARSLWWWLPPVIWPNEEQTVRQCIAGVRKKGATKFVLNSPWQIALFDDPRENLVLWAGPFCNLANAFSLAVLRGLGFSGAVVSMELSRPDFLGLAAQSPLPLGIVSEGVWPLCVSRTKPAGLAPETAFKSPFGEVAWTRKYGQNTWVFAGWLLSLKQEQRALERAGYSLFIHLHEPWPQGAPKPGRTSHANWDIGLL